MKAKYLKGGTSTQRKPNHGHSHFWAGVVEAKDWFCKCCQRIVGDNMKTRHLLRILPFMKFSPEA